MNNFLNYLKAGGIGLIAGIIGAVIGFLPIDLLKIFLVESILLRVFGSYGAIPDYLLYITGLPLPSYGVVLVPIGGALFGIIGALIGLGRHSSRVWLWGGIFGLLFNLFIFPMGM